MGYDMPAQVTQARVRNGQGKPPTDYTGRKLATDAKVLQDERIASKDETALAEQAEIARRKNTVIDLTDPQNPIEKPLRRSPAEATVVSEVETEDAPADEVEVVEVVEAKPKTRRIRVNWEVREMTLGREILDSGEFDDKGVMLRAPRLGSLRIFNFEPGRWYDVPADVAAHLEYIGYIDEL
jgi:hypothetical protein